MEISVVIPAKNEENNVKPLIAEIISALDGVADYEIVFVDDGSTDDTYLRFWMETGLQTQHRIIFGNSISLKAQREQARKELQIFNASRISSRVRFSPRIH